MAKLAEVRLSAEEQAIVDALTKNGSLERAVEQAWKRKQRGERIQFSSLEEFDAHVKRNAERRRQTK